MSTEQRIFHILDALKINQKTFAEEIGTTNKVVSKWKAGSLKSYQKYLREIVDYLNIPPDYFLEQGVFSNWDSILKYPLSVYNELRKHIPKGYIDTSFDRDTYLEAWLDVRMCYGITGENEVDLIRWFYRNIAKVSIRKDDEISESISPANVQIMFIEYRFGPFKNEKPAPVPEGEPNINVIKIAGRDGTFVERKLTDEQLKALTLMLDQLPSADDL